MDTSSAGSASVGTRCSHVFRDGTDRGTARPPCQGRISPTDRQEVLKLPIDHLVHSDRGNRNRPRRFSDAHPPSLVRSVAAELGFPCRGPSRFQHVYTHFQQSLLMVILARRIIILLFVVQNHDSGCAARTFLKRSARTLHRLDDLGLATIVFLLRSRRDFGAQTGMLDQSFISYTDMRGLSTMDVGVG